MSKITHSLSDGFVTQARCMWMRGGTSKGGYFLAEDLPSDKVLRDKFLLEIMGSPDSRQIDGMGGADPLTSKVAIIKKSSRANIDVDYLFLQVFVDKPIVTDSQNCGNILAGIAPFAIERGLVALQGDTTTVRIYMENTGQTAIATVQTPNGKVCYKGTTHLDGVPTDNAPITVIFSDTAGSTCGALLPTGKVKDIFDGIEVTCIDNGMPVVVLRASDLGITGTESRSELDENNELKQKLECIRLQAGQKMNLGDVSQKSVPKITLISPALHGGVVNTRTFIPHRCHASIGVFGAVSVATATTLQGSVAEGIAKISSNGQTQMLIEHPSGTTAVLIEQDITKPAYEQVTASGLVLTARKLFDGIVFAQEQ